MKKNITLLLLVFAIFPLAAQTQLPTSKTIVGMWSQKGITNFTTGEYKEGTIPFYKIINADGTFYTFISTPTSFSGREPIISQYGTYKILTDNDLTEHIIGHAISPNMINTDTKLKYELLDDKTLILSWSKDGETWFKEKWERVGTTVNNIPEMPKFK